VSASEKLRALEAAELADLHHADNSARNEILAALDSLAAELERVKAERDAAQRMADHMMELDGPSAWGIARAEKELAQQTQARLDKALSALREIAGPFGAEWPDAQDRARAAIAEIEGEA